MIQNILIMSRNADIQELLKKIEATFQIKKNECFMILFGVITEHL